MKPVILKSAYQQRLLFMKLFKTNNIDIIGECQPCFSVDMPCELSVTVTRQRLQFIFALCILSYGKLNVLFAGYRCIAIKTELFGCC